MKRYGSPGHMEEEVFDSAHPEQNGHHVIDEPVVQEVSAKINEIALNFMDKYY